MIKPTVGRVVWYTPPLDVDRRGDPTQPLAATIAYVNSDRSVNISYFDQDGTQRSAVAVELVQEGDSRPSRGRFCEWMPYQKGQAAKTEQLEKQIGGAA